MKIRSLEMLSDYLASDLGWRKKELTDIRQLTQLAANAPRRRALTRCGVALLYAHFEGFTKQAGQAYLEYVAAQRLHNDQIARNFLAVSLCHLLSPVAASRKASSYVQAVELFLDKGDARASIPYRAALDTESNLSSKVLREIIFSLGLDYSPFEPKEKLVDSRLLARRNHIAHGDRLDLDDAEYDELHGSIIDILNSLRNQIENAAAQRMFVRSA